MRLLDFILVAFVGETFAFTHQPSQSFFSSSTSSLCMSATSDGESRRTFVSKTASAAAAASVATTFGLPEPSEAASQMWSKVPVPFDDTLYDIDFDSEKHGYLVGARGAFAETNDGGLTWEARSFSNLDPEEKVTYRFE